ncbi:MFS transporter [Candidatus Nucleicultrix amoebiphila]|jgi:MFS family permease|uniref:MFS transporter n=1 Tax=Candidatus Nucleicultrix amoebiphila TaxID=1509244 RepID=UPI000A26B17C|nr:MFS transporter [Candidatus Nucleicultrix amoebiphila]
MKHILRNFLQLPQSIWAIGIVSLLINVSSVIVFMASPYYLTKVFGVTTIGLGFIEGLVEFTAWATRIISGMTSDYMSKRKPALVVAYGLNFISRILFVLAPGIGLFFLARSIDRLSNGIQATPREALVGDLAPKHLKGASYGLRQTLSVAGSVLGALVMIAFFLESGENYSYLFIAATIPPLFALYVMLCHVRDVPREKMMGPLHPTKIFSWSSIVSLSNNYWRVVAVACFFTLSNYSGAFLLIHAEKVGISQHLIPLVMVVQNFSAMIAYPIGRLSDRMDRRYLLAIGFFMVVISGVILALAYNIWMALLGAAFWGLHIGINQSLLMAKVADTTVPETRGTAFGVFYLLIGITLFLSNNIMGWISHHMSPSASFITSALIAGVAIFSLPLIKSYKKKNIEA